MLCKFLAVALLPELKDHSPSPSTHKAMAMAPSPCHIAEALWLPVNHLMENIEQDGVLEKNTTTTTEIITTTYIHYTLYVFFTAN